MIFHIRLTFWRRAHAKFLGRESVPLIEGPCFHVDLQGIQPEMVRRNLPGMLEQCFSNSAILKIGMYI